MEAYLRGNNVCVLGPAGSGKSRLLSRMISHARKHAMGDEEVVVLAQTNAQAVAIGGVTISSFFGLPVLGLGMLWTKGTLLGHLRRCVHVQKRLRACEKLFLDEVAVLPAGLTDGILAMLTDTARGDGTLRCEMLQGRQVVSKFWSACRLLCKLH